jgi:hypothetical protein
MGGVRPGAGRKVGKGNPPRPKTEYDRLKGVAAEVAKDERDLKRARRILALRDDHGEARKKAQEMVRTVERLSGNGLDPKGISALTGIKPDRLYRKYRDAMIRGKATRLSDLAEMGFLVAMGGPERDWRRADATQIRFELERRGGDEWAPPSQKVQVTQDLSRLSMEELMALERVAAKLQGVDTGARVMIEDLRGGDLAKDVTPSVVPSPVEEAEAQSGAEPGDENATP